MTRATISSAGRWELAKFLWNIFHGGEASVQRAMCCYNMVMAVS